MQEHLHVGDDLDGGAYGTRSSSNGVCVCFHKEVSIMDTSAHVGDSQKKENFHIEGTAWT